MYGLQNCCQTRTPLCDPLNLLKEELIFLCLFHAVCFVYERQIMCLFCHTTNQEKKIVFYLYTTRTSYISGFKSDHLLDKFINLLDNKLYGLLDNLNKIIHLN